MAAVQNSNAAATTDPTIPIETEKAEKHLRRQSESEAESKRSRMRLVLPTSPGRGMSAVL
jgi:hypothetical protein